MSNDRLRAFLFAAFVLTGTLAARSARAESKKVSIAVLRFDDRGAGSDLTANVAALVSNELARFSILRVVSSQDIAALISVKAQQQLLGCTDASCVVNLSNTLGTDYVITGDVGKVGKSTLVTLQLIHQSTATVDAREDLHTDGTLDALIREVQETTRRLIRPILRAREGSLLVSTSIEGANVYVDDKLVGVTPLRRLVITWGPHTIRVERSGFIAFARDVDIDSDGALDVDATLVPSTEFIAAYESRARTIRNAAWGMLATTVATGAVSLGTYLEAEHELDAFNGKISALQNAGVLTVSGGTYRYATAADQTANEPTLTSLRNSGNTELLVSEVMLGVACASAVTSLALFVAGDDPARYERFKEQHMAGLEPTLTINGPALAWRF